MTVSELREKLEGALCALEDYDDDQKVNVHCNTYGLGQNFIAVREGFVSLSDMVDDDEC